MFPDCVTVRSLVLGSYLPRKLTARGTPPIRGGGVLAGENELLHGTVKITVTYTVWVTLVLFTNSAKIGHQEESGKLL